MILEPVPSSFIVERTQPTLSELRWALENGVIGAQTVVDVAGAVVAREDAPSNLTVQLASVSHAELPEVSERLAEVPLPSDDAETKRKWTWVLLSWAYERHRDDEHVADVLGELYADLGYPEEMVPFGPYAPAYQGKRDPADVRRDILHEWRKYLEHGAERFAA